MYVALSLSGRKTFMPYALLRPIFQHSNKPYTQNKQKSIEVINNIAAIDEFRQNRRISKEFKISMETYPKGVSS